MYSVLVEKQKQWNLYVSQYLKSYFNELITKDS